LKGEIDELSEEVLDVYGVDRAMIHLEGDWLTVIDGKDFVLDVVRRYYKDLDEILKDVKGGELC